MERLNRRARRIEIMLGVSLFTMFSLNLPALAADAAKPGDNQTEAKTKTEKSGHTEQIDSAAKSETTEGEGEGEATAEADEEKSRPIRDKWAL
ncbi:MAG TPA: hypothetical protein PKC98_25020, partial [Candidatus Melainabacteria bacterium]|nr:hypothetical protein [Candidatus Melainabacteria bacterium]